MQVLLFVFGILMAISLMTYQRIAAFRDLTALRQEYACYMETTEHIDFNETQIAQYDDHHGKGTENTGESERINAVRKINLNPLLTGGDKEKLYNNQYLLLSNLIRILYSDQPFYQKIHGERQGFVDEMLHAMIKEAKNFKPKMTKVASLANLDLHDADLQSVFVKMLNGNHENNQAGQCSEGLGAKDYDSLLDYIDIETKNPPIRVQLTSKNVLLAIFRDPILVDQIIQDRNRLRNQVSQNKDKKSDASLEFERYKERIPREFDQAQFNFQITSTKE